MQGPTQPMTGAAPAQQPPAQPPGEQPPQQQAGFGQQKRATPEQQELYDKLVGQAFNLIYEPKMFEKVIGMLAGEGDPKQGLATTAVQVIGRVADSAQKNGIKVDGQVLFHAGKEIFEDLAELSRRAGIKDYAQDPDALEGAYFLAMDEFRVLMQQSGRLNPEAAKRDMAMLQQMDQSGELERSLVEMARRDEGAGQQEPGAGEPQGQPERQEPPRGRGLMQGGA